MSLHQQLKKIQILINELDCLIGETINNLTTQHNQKQLELARHRLHDVQEHVWSVINKLEKKP